MDTPFKLYFEENQRRIEIPCYTSMEQCVTEAPIQLLENRRLTCIFSGEGTVQFDCLEDTFTSGVHVLYQYEHNLAYPFLPGEQLGCVKTASETYYFRFIIQPRVSVAEHEQMMQEIEAFLKGYSTQHTQAFTHALPEQFFHILYQIQQHPIQQMAHIYELEEMGRGGRINQRSQLYAMRHPQEQRQLVQKKKMNWNLPANQMLKIQLQNSLAIVSPYEATRIRQFLQQDWMQTVDVPSHYIHSNDGMYNPYYREISQILQNRMNQPIVRGTVQKSKSGAEIYEVWGYLKVIEYLKELGYTSRNAELTLKNNSKGDVTFDHDTQNYVELVKEDTVFRVFWEDALLRDARKVSPMQPLYTWHNHTPDCRIDFWHKGIYKGTHIIDFKYRHLEKRWTEQVAYSDPVDSMFKQLSAYALARSNSQQLNNVAEPLLDVAPVKQVWAVTPYTTTHQETIEGYPLQLHTLQPGSQNESFKCMLESIVQTM